MIIVGGWRARPFSPRCPAARSRMLLPHSRVTASKDRADATRHPRGHIPSAITSPTPTAGSRTETPQTATDKQHCVRASRHITAVWSSPGFVDT
jgi:hypothetical protein